MTLTSFFQRHGTTLACAAAALLLAGCASVPPPTALVTRAEQQIEAAQAAQAADFAPVDLGFAKQRYQAAQAAMSVKSYQLAQDMANESLADGRLAQTRAELAAVRRQVRAQKAENTRLRTQLLNDSAASRATSGSADAGVPTQIVLPQAKAPPAATSTPAPPASSPTPAGGGQ